MTIYESDMFDATNGGTWYWHISKGAAAATACGKAFILWNDRVYHIGVDNYFDTGFVKQDMRDGRYDRICKAAQEAVE